MYNDLRNKAIANLEKRKKKEKKVQVIGVIFGSICALLFGISQFMTESDRPYMLIPIGIIVLIFGIIYTAMLGLPFVPDDDITEEDIEYEVAKIYRKYKSKIDEELSEDEVLEIRQIDSLLRNRDDYV